MRRMITRIAVLVLLLWLTKPLMGGRVWGDHGVLVATDMEPAYPSLCQLGELEMTAAFPCFDEDGIYRAAVQGISWDGALFFEEEPLYLSAPDKWMYDSNIIAVTDGEGGVFVVWQTTTEIPKEYDVYAQHLDQDLQTLWDDGGVLLYRTNDDIASTTRYHHHGIMVSDEGGLIVVDRREVGEHPSLYDHLFFVRKFDAEGNLADGWPQEGIQVFEIQGNIQFYTEPGRGIWCYGRNGRGHGESLWVNLVQTDGILHYNETVLPEIPDNTLVDDFCPAGDGGFYLMMYQLAEGDWCNSGIQRYNPEGNPVWDDGDIWFAGVERSHVSQIPIVSENGNRVLCFMEEGEDANSTYVYSIEPGEDGPNLMLEDPMYFPNCRVRPFFFMGDGDLLLNIMCYEWNDEYEFWSIQRAEANIVAPNGMLLWNDGEVPIEPYGMAAPRDWETFFVATELETPDQMSDLRVDCYNQWAESEWRDPIQVYFMPQFGNSEIVQLLPDGVVRVIGKTYMFPGPHEATYNYQLINPDGSLQLPIAGNQFFELVERAECVTSCGSLIMVRYEGGPGSEVYRDVSILNDQNELHPDNPLPLEDLIQNSEFKEASGDSMGGGFLVFCTGEDDDRRTDIIRIDRNCEWDEQVLRPFDQLILGNPDILPDGTGGAWVAGRTSDREFILQRISPENELVWNEPRMLEWNALGTVTPLRLAAGDTSFWALVRVRTENLDSVNVVMMSYDRDGSPRWNTPVAAFEPNVGFEHENLFLRAIANQEGNVWIVCWERFNAPPMFNEIRLQLISPDGERMLGEQGLSLPLMSKSFRPQLVNDGDGGVWVFMEVFNLDHPQLRSFHFNRNGELIDDLPEPDPNGTACMLPLVEGLPTGSFLPPWIYDNGDVGIAFDYGVSLRAQRISDDPSYYPSGGSESPRLFEITSV